MTNENKRFRIEQIDRYEEQISQEEKNTTRKTFLLGLTTAAMVGSISESASLDPHTINHFLGLFLGLINAGTSVYYLKNLIESINRKTALQTKLEELKMKENNETGDKER